MDIIFYNNVSDDDTIGKNLTVVTTLTGDLKNDCSIENPEILIKNTGMINANYAYISEFNRYYYIENQIILSNNLVRVNMSVDVLETFKTVDVIAAEDTRHTLQLLTHFEIRKRRS